MPCMSFKTLIAFEGVSVPLWGHKVGWNWGRGGLQVTFFFTKKIVKKGVAFGRLLLLLFPYLMGTLKGATGST